MKLECARFNLCIASPSLVINSLVPHRCPHLFMLPSLHNIPPSLKVCTNIRIAFFLRGEIECALSQHRRLCYGASSCLSGSSRDHRKLLTPVIDLTRPSHRLEATPLKGLLVRLICPCPLPPHTLYESLFS